MYPNKMPYHFLLTNQMLYMSLLLESLYHIYEQILYLHNLIIISSENSIHPLSHASYSMHIMNLLMSLISTILLIPLYHLDQHSISLVNFLIIFLLYHPHIALLYQNNLYHSPNKPELSHLIHPANPHFLC